MGKDARELENTGAALCPLCGGTGDVAFSRHGHLIRDCVACGHRFCRAADPARHVQRTYTDAYFTDGAAGYRGFEADAAVNRSRGRAYARVVAPWVGAPGRLLDVGAAAGHVLAGWVDAGWTGVGLEPNARAAEIARERTGVDVRHATLEAWEGDGRFDLVSMVQVLPHFLDVHAALEAARRHLVPGGWLLVETWDRQSRTARLMGRHWHEYAPPSVLHWFDPASLRKLVEGHGLRRAAQGRPRRRIRMDHARSVMRHALSGSVLRPLASPLALLPGRMTLPYPGDDLFWMLFRAESV